jgi:dihydroorotase
VVGEHLAGDRRIAAEGVVIAGRWWHPNEPAEKKRQAAPG